MGKNDKKKRVGGLEEIMDALLQIFEFASTHTSHELLQKFLDEAELLTNSKVGFFHFVEEDQTSLSLQAWSTNTMKMCKAPGAGSHYPIEKAGVWVECVKKRAPVIHNDYASLPNKKGTPEGHVPIVRELVVPVFRGKKLVAILGVGNKETDYDDSDLKIVSQLADLGWECVLRRRTEEENVELKEQYHAILEDSPLLICRYLPGGEITYVNDIYCRYFNKSFDELVGNSFYPLIPEEDREKVREVISSLTVESPSKSQEHHVIGPNGEIRWQRWTDRALFDANNKVIAYQSVGEDITKRKQTEEALKMSEASFREAEKRNRAWLDNSPVCTKIVDPDFNLQFMSSSGIQDLNIDDISQFYGKPYPFYFYPESFKKTMTENLKKAKKTGNVVVQEASVEDTNGNELWYHSTIVPVFDDKEEIDYLMVVSLNTTDRKLAEKALRESEENLRITLNSIGDAVIAIDLNGNIVQMNPIAEKLTGRIVKESVGKPFSEIFHIINANSRKPVISPVEKVLKYGKIIGISNNTILLSKDGSEYQIADSAAPIKDSGGETVGVVLVFRDITKEYMIQEELYKMQKLQSIGTLAGGIAHDFNNILTGIFGNVSMAKLELPNDHEAYRILEEVETSANWATRLTQQLLIFAKGGEPVKEHLPINSLIYEIVRFDLSGSNVKPVIEEDECLWFVYVDKGHIQQVISNLTINADQAMPDGGHLYISMKNAAIPENTLLPISPGKYVKITIKDEGVGIDKEHLEKIFDPYFSTKQDGSGLGLATSFSIIQKHDGHISVESKLGKGTTFTLYLPATLSSEDSGTPLQETKVPELGRNKKVLIMDDEKMIRDLLSRMLKKNDWNVVTATDGKEAVEKYRKAAKKGKIFDIVILDLTIPGGMGGSETVKEILKINPDAKAIVCSGYGDDPVLANYEDYGFKGMIAKPFNINKLNEVLRDIIK